jgi:hypothetical protein
MDKLLACNAGGALGSGIAIAMQTFLHQACPVTKIEDGARKMLGRRRRRNSGLAIVKRVAGWIVTVMVSGMSGPRGSHSKHAQHYISRERQVDYCHGGMGANGSEECGGGGDARWVVGVWWVCGGCVVREGGGPNGVQGCVGTGSSPSVDPRQRPAILEAVGRLGKSGPGASRVPRTVPLPARRRC